MGRDLLVAISAVGRATLAALDLNHDRRLRIREAEIRFGLLPPRRKGGTSARRNCGTAARRPTDSPTSDLRPPTSD